MKILLTGKIQRARLSENFFIKLFLHPASSIQHPASSIQHPASSIQHPSSIIRFTLNENPLSELADGEGNVIENAKLSVAEAKFKGQKAEGKGQNEGLISVYPNPAKEVLNVEFVTGIEVNNAAAVDMPWHVHGNYQKNTKVIVNREVALILFSKNFALLFFPGEF